MGSVEWRGVPGGVAHSGGHYGRGGERIVGAPGGVAHSGGQPRRGDERFEGSSVE